MNRKITRLVSIILILCSLFNNVYALELIEEVNTDGLKAASYIITQKYMLDKVSVYCGDLIGKEKDWAPAAMSKWLEMNDKYYSRAIDRIEEYVQHTQIKYGPEMAKQTRKQFRQLFTEKGDVAVSDHFSKIENEESKMAECNAIANQIENGGLNINESNDEIAMDMKKLLNPYKLDLYEGQN